MKRIAIVCDTASFRLGGEASIPLRFFRSFRALDLEPVLFCHGRVEQDLRSVLTAEELHAVVFFADTRLQRMIFNAGLRLPERIQEVFTFNMIRAITELRQRRELRARIRRQEIDVVFQPVPISPKAISLLANMGVPVFFGPLNGAIDYPPAFNKSTSRFTQWIINLGRVVAEPLHYVFPAKRQASGIFVSNQRTLDALPGACQLTAKFRSFDATIDSEHWRGVRRSPDFDATHFLYVGRLVDLKGVDLAIEAVHSIGGRAKLTIVGNGPERARLEALAAAGPAQIDFAGYLSHDQLVALYEMVCALILPSLREAGGNVCLEALASGVPVISLRWGGAADVVKHGEEGILVDPIGPREVVIGLADAMQAMMADPARVRAMGSAGRLRVLDAFDWRNKAADFHRVFMQEAAGANVTGAVEDAHPSHVQGSRINLAWR